MEIDNLYLGDKLIATSTPVKVINFDDNECEFYYRRKDKLFFKRPGKVLTIEISNQSDQLKSVKIGTLVTINFNAK